MQPQFQVAIIGGGLAGLTAAIHLLHKGYKVTVFEKNEYPKHKVCGEFISNEILPYWESLGVTIHELNPTTINQTVISLPNGKQLKTTLPLGGFGLSRYTLDQYLAQKVIDLGGEIVQTSIETIIYQDNLFQISASNGLTYSSSIAMGCFGKRSNLDIHLKRNFIQEKSTWLAVKAHYSGNFPNDLVALHNFEGGYCGVSKVENDRINLCYLVKYEVFKRYKSIDDFQTNVLYQNPRLKHVFKESNLLFDKPLTISQISFEEKEQVENHILMLGDTAGLIHPLCGNGMAMAVHSAKIASECVISFLEGNQNREEMEKKYALQWNHHFRQRLQMGKQLSKLLLNQSMSQILMKLLLTFPKLVPLIIRKTHGKPIL